MVGPHRGADADRVVTLEDSCGSIRDAPSVTMLATGWCGAAAIRQASEMAAVSTLLLSEHPDRVDATRVLLEEYLSLADAWERFGGVPVRLPAFLEHEITAFPGNSVPPDGDVIVGVADNGNVVAAGHVVPAEPFLCEFKRLYVRPDDRGKGTARQVAEAMINRARALGYRRAVLDVMPERAAAVVLWTRVGFRPCSPYRTYPFPMEFMELDLVDSASGPRAAGKSA